MNQNTWIGLTMGDPAGVGPELCVRALSDPALRPVCNPLVFGSASVLERASTAISVPLPETLQRLRPGEIPQAPGPAVIDIPTLNGGQITPGRVSADCGAAAFHYIESAIDYALAGRICAVATAPIHKEALRLAGVQYPGHTEIFTALTRAKRTCMLLYSETLSVSMVTTHVGYHEVPSRLSVDRIAEVIELTAAALQNLTGRKPRLGVCGLNPHAGEHGLFGNREEEQFIEPAIAQSRARGIDANGPLPPDAAFTAQSRARFDGVVCMYHDQGHIPFKMVAFDEGVNITLGLPIVRTSVDHGTAFDIAWRGIARPISFFKSIQYAITLSRQSPSE